MNSKTVLVIDGGGRGSVLVDKYLKSKHVSRALALPGNDLMTLEKNVKIFPQFKTTDIAQIVKVCKKEKVDLVDVAQDDAVAAGLVDKLKKQKINVFGPTKKSGQIEWDKAWAREFMKRIELPIPKYRIFKSPGEAVKFIKRQNDSRWFVKVSGLAAGKGSIFARNNKHAQIAIKSMKNFGDAAKTFLVEECLDGEEFSAFAIVNGKRFEIIGYAQDHKNVFDGDKGPNTGGMGCTSPPLAVDENIENQVRAIFKKTVEGLAKIGRPYTGILYLGGIIDQKGKVKIIEFNARWGDPEAQVLIPAIENDLYELVTYVMKGQFPKIKQSKSYRVVVAVASKGYPHDFRKVLGKEIKGLKKLIKSKTKIFSAGVKIKNDKFTVAGGRLFYVLGEGKEVAIARQKAYNALSLVRIDRDFLHYRHDIGWRDMKRVKPKFDK